MPTRRDHDVGSLALSYPKQRLALLPPRQGKITSSLKDTLMSLKDSSNAKVPHLTDVTIAEDTHGLVHQGGMCCEAGVRWTSRGCIGTKRTWGEPSRGGGQSISPQFQQALIRWPHDHKNWLKTDNKNRSLSVYPLSSYWVTKLSMIKLSMNDQVILDADSLHVFLSLSVHWKAAAMTNSAMGSTP